MRSLLPLLLLACTAEDDLDPLDTDTDVAFSDLRVALAADMHVPSDAYALADVGDNAKGRALATARDRFVALRDELHDISPAPEEVFLLGDMVHDGTIYETVEDNLDRDGGSAEAVVKEVLDSFELPYDLLLGNHEYNGADGDPERVHAVWKAIAGVDPWHARDLGGWRFLFLNTKIGDFPRDPMSAFTGDDGYGSLGEDQLAWAAEQLADGRPTILLMHHHPLVGTLVPNEAPDAVYPDIFALVEAHQDVVKGIFMGHLHYWLNADTYFPVPAWVMAAPLYDADNYWVLDLDRDGEDYEIVDFDKAVFGTPNSHGARYDQPRPFLDLDDDPSDDSSGGQYGGDWPPAWPPAD